MEEEQDDNAHDSYLKCVRFNASSITVKESQTGEAFGEIMEKYERIAAEEGRLTAICDMIEFGLSKEQILTKYSEDEYNKAKKNAV